MCQNGRVPRERILVLPRVRTHIASTYHRPPKLYITRGARGHGPQETEMAPNNVQCSSGAVPEPKDGTSDSTTKTSAPVVKGKAASNVRSVSHQSIHHFDYRGTQGGQEATPRTGTSAINIYCQDYHSHQMVGTRRRANQAPTHHA